MPFSLFFNFYFLTVYPIVVFILLFLNWIIFSGKFDVFHLGLGIVSCVVVTWLSQDLLYFDRAKGFLARVREAWGFIGYIPWLTWEVVLANVHVLN